MNRYKQGWFGESYRHHLAAKGVKTAYYQQKDPRISEVDRRLRKMNKQLAEQEQEFYSDISGIKRRKSKGQERATLRPVKEHTLLGEPAVSDVSRPPRAGFIPLPVGGGEEELIEQEVPEEFREERKLLLQQISELEQELQDFPSAPYAAIEDAEFQPVIILEQNPDGTFYVKTMEGYIHKVPKESVVDMALAPGSLRRDFGQLRNQIQSKLNNPNDFNTYLEGYMRGELSGKLNSELLAKPELIDLFDKVTASAFLLSVVDKSDQLKNKLKAAKRKHEAHLADIEKRGVAVNYRALRSSDEVFFQRIPLGELRAWLASETNRPLDDFKAWDRSEVVSKVLELPQRKKLRQEYTKHMEESGEYFPGFVKGFQKQLVVGRPAALDRQRATQERAEQRERVFRMPETLSPEERKAVIDTQEQVTGVRLLGRQPVEKMQDPVLKPEDYEIMTKSKKMEDLRMRQRFDPVARKKLPKLEEEYSQIQAEVLKHAFKHNKEDK